MGKFDYVISLLKNEINEFYVNKEMEKEIREAIKILKKEGKKVRKHYKANGRSKNC